MQVIGAPPGMLRQQAILRDEAMKTNEKKWYPKGFDIDLMEAISEYDLSEKQIERLGHATKHPKEWGLAVAVFGGKNFYYRRSQIESMFVDEK